MGRRTVLVALLIFTVVTVSGCGGLLGGGGSAEDELTEMLKAQAQAGGSSTLASVECEESDALDHMESLDKAHTCNVTWEDGSSGMFCLVKDGSQTGSLPEACEALAAGGWGRS
jgi:hypothetical protein